MSGRGSYKHGSRRGSAARFPSWVILLPAAAPTVPGPAAPSTAATNAAAILHWPAAATTTASALGACACAATLSGPVCDEVLEETEGRVVARALGSQPSSEDAEGAGLRTNGKQSEGRVRSPGRRSCSRGGFRRPRFPRAGKADASWGPPRVGEKLRFWRAGGRPPGRPPFCPAFRYWERAVVAGFPPITPLPPRTLFSQWLLHLRAPFPPESFHSRLSRFREGLGTLRVPQRLFVWAGAGRWVPQRGPGAVRSARFGRPKGACRGLERRLPGAGMWVQAADPFHLLYRYRAIMSLCIT